MGRTSKPDVRPMAWGRGSQMHHAMRLLLWIGCLCTPVGAFASDRLYAEFPMASVTVGMDGAKPVRRVLTLGLAGPDALFSQVEYCTTHALKTHATNTLVLNLPRLESQAKLIEE